jgi:hypothetical protein
MGVNVTRQSPKGDLWGSLDKARVATYFWLYTPKETGFAQNSPNTYTGFALLCTLLLIVK